MTSDTILLIGGTRNLGALLAAGLRDSGATVIATSSRPGTGGLHLDLLDEGTITAAARELGAVDHVISTAALPHDPPVGEIDADKLAAAFGAKVLGPILVAKHLEIRKSLTLLSGAVGWKPSANSLVKGTVNVAVAALARHLAAQLAPVRVNAVSPGLVDSGAWSDAVLTAAAARSPLGSLASPGEVLDAVRWVLSAQHLTGETIHLEGGRW